MPQAILELKPFVELIFSIIGGISAIALGVMAVVLSRRANQIADAQTKLLDKQTTFIEEQLKPFLRLRFRTVTDTEEEVDIVEVWNDGSAIQDFSIRQYSFLVVNRWRPGEAVASKWFPAFYLFDRESTKEARGLLVTLKSTLRLPRQKINTRTFVQDVTRCLQGHWDNSVAISVQVFLEIHCFDLLGNMHRSFYHVNPEDFISSGMGLRLDSNQADRIRKAFGPASPNRPFYGDDPAETWASMVIQEWPTLMDGPEILGYHMIEPSSG